MQTWFYPVCFQDSTVLKMYISVALITHAKPRIGCVHHFSESPGKQFPLAVCAVLAACVDLICLCKFAVLWSVRATVRHPSDSSRDPLKREPTEINYTSPTWVTFRIRASSKRWMGDKRRRSCWLKWGRTAALWSPWWRDGEGSQSGQSAGGKAGACTERWAETLKQWTQSSEEEGDEEGERVCEDSCF